MDTQTDTAGQQPSPSEGRGVVAATLAQGISALMVLAAALTVAVLAHAPVSGEPGEVPADDAGERIVYIDVYKILTADRRLAAEQDEVAEDLQRRLREVADEYRPKVESIRERMRGQSQTSRQRRQLDTELWDLTRSRFHKVSALRDERDELSESLARRFEARLEDALFDLADDPEHRFTVVIHRLDPEMERTEIPLMTRISRHYVVWSKPGRDITDKVIELVNEGFVEPEKPGEPEEPETPDAPDAPDAPRE